MKFELPKLPFAKDALEPYISSQTLNYHYDKHHQGYLNKLKAAIDGKPEAQLSLEEVILKAEGPVFNSAAQVWNHSFYWESMTPNGGGKPTGAVLSLLEQSFGSFESFKQQLAEAANGQFGAGWAWLIAESQSKLSITKTSNADTPLRQNKTALLTIDVWEHAYYLDYKNERDNYVKAVIDRLINWSFVEKNLAQVK
jgi:Fe-Mn family superoxide dismutase